MFYSPISILIGWDNLYVLARMHLNFYMFALSLEINKTYLAVSRVWINRNLVLTSTKSVNSTTHSASEFQTETISENSSPQSDRLMVNKNSLSTELEA